MGMAKKVRLLAGAVGMAPVLGLAPAAPAATAAAVHASGKTVSLQAAGRAAGATACTGTYSNVATAASTHLGILVSYEGNCVLGITGTLRFSSKSGGGSASFMRTRVYNHGARVLSGRAEFYYSNGSVRASQNGSVIGHRVCATAFSQAHPSVKIAGPVCVKI